MITNYMHESIHKVFSTCVVQTMTFFRYHQHEVYKFMKKSQHDDCVVSTKGRPRQILIKILCFPKYSYQMEFKLNYNDKNANHTQATNYSY